MRPTRRANGNNAHERGPRPPTARLIGPGLRLDGKTAGPRSPASWFAGLDRSASPVTWSAWIKPAALAANTVVFSRRDGGNDFLVGVDSPACPSSTSTARAARRARRSRPTRGITSRSWAERIEDVAFISTAPSYGSVSGAGPDAQHGRDGSAVTRPRRPPAMRRSSGEMDELEISKRGARARLPQVRRRRAGCRFLQGW